MRAPPPYGKDAGQRLGCPARKTDKRERRWTLWL
uniref:Uncharacterized protein n=1 Tax=Siphoviridae sp. ctij073 TaxID=2825625 RepID=A0A8S5U9Y9_9CAUD|nr:MAG TPA: hypothetical protein [Siphoviridae sp. ctij073]